MAQKSRTLVGNQQSLRLPFKQKYPQIILGARIARSPRIAEIDSARAYFETLPTSAAAVKL